MVEKGWWKDAYVNMEKFLQEAAFLKNVFTHLSPLPLVWLDGVWELFRSSARFSPYTYVFLLIIPGGILCCWIGRVSTYIRCEVPIEFPFMLNM